MHRLSLGAIPRREVIGDRVTSDMVENRLLRHVARHLADDNRKLCFPVKEVGVQLHVCIWADDAP